MTDVVLTRGTVSSGGESIYWELASAGSDDDRPVVVLSHGLGGSHAIWYQQVPVLGRHYRVLTWDSRGFGNSTNNQDEPTADAGGGDLEAILDHLGIGEAHFVGQSMGGWPTSAFALTNPQRVRSLVYADTVGGLWTQELRDGMPRPGSVDFLQSAPQPLSSHPALWAGTGDRDPAQAFLYRAMSSFHTPPSRILEILDWTADHGDVAVLGVPVLFVVGSHDDLFPPGPLKACASLIPHAEFIEISDAGHSPYFEQPRAWNDAVLSFLRAAV